VRAAFKAPWFIDLLNLNLENDDLSVAKDRIATYMEKFQREGARITETLDFE
jgi:malate synthase